MARYLADIETDNLLEKLTKVHCIVAVDLDTGMVHQFADQPGYQPLAKGLAVLSEADYLAGHNFQGFDAPALEKVYPGFKLKPTCIVRDTLLMSQLLWPELLENDFKFARKPRGKNFPKKYYGRHSLAAWGARLGCPKDDYSDRMKEKGLDPWENWNEDMQLYCVQDVHTNIELWRKIESKNYHPFAVDLEHRFAHIIRMQERHGVRFNETKATALYAKLCRKRAELGEGLAELFPAWWVNLGRKTPKRSITYKKNPMQGSPTKDCPYTVVELRTFNPGSRDHIADRLQAKYSWTPTEFGKDGKPTVDDTILAAMPYPEAVALREYLTVIKRIGQLAEGKVAWLKKVKDGRLHGRVDTVGAITRRCTHFGPNLAQAPKVSVEYGEEMRGCFIADVGYVLVGWDASGLELRCLGHYVARFDGGAYKDIILLGDVHTKNMQAIGLFGRNFAKTWIYAYLYGAGDLKLGSIVIEDARYAGEDVPKGSVKAIGKRSRDNYERDVAALKKLREGIDTRAKKNGGFMNAIDGGSIVVRHAHAALNTLLQSAGAIAMKLALVILYDKLTALGWTHGVQYAFVLNIHDEVQACVLPTHVQTYKECAVAAIREAGEQLGFRCQLDAEAKEGNSWADTH